MCLCLLGHDLSFGTKYRRYSTSSDTVYCFMCSLQIYVSQRRRARGGNSVISFININKYTSVSENVHLCLSQHRQLGRISVATGRIPSLFCDCLSGETLLQDKKTPLVVSGTRTQVLVDSIDIAASALNHCAT